MPKYELPDGHHIVTPGMVVPHVARLIEFLGKAFGGVVMDRYDMPGGHVAHAEVKLGDSVVMMGEPMGDFEPMPCMLSLYVDDVDAVHRRAVEAGGVSLEEPNDTFYGYRSARVRDPAGNHWAICAVVEKLTKEQIQERMAKMGSGAS